MASGGQSDAPSQLDQVVKGEMADNDTTTVNGTFSEDQWPDPPTDRARFFEDLQLFHNQRG